jgi:hypothetical protein
MSKEDNMYLFRLLISGIGIIVGIIGFMMVTGAWMNRSPVSFNAWATLIAGAVMWFQGVPLMLAAERQESDKRIAELLNKK